MEPSPLQQTGRTYVRAGGRTLSYFAGCDYFRLASHPRVLRAAAGALKKYGLNVAASRMTTGNHELFGRLEKALAQFFAVSSATLVSNGYLTNLVAAQALAGEFSHALLDGKAHPSLKDAAQFLQCPILTFEHRSPEDLARVLARIGKSARPIVLTDGLFSADGSIAPLRAYARLLPREAWLLVDDAHGAGTLGETGKGTVELEGVKGARVIQTVTLSKAFGCYGGAILGPRQLREKILDRSGMFIGNTPLPLPLAGAALEAVAILKEDRKLRLRLLANVARVKDSLRAAGYGVSGGPGPIIAIVPDTPSHAAALTKRCLENGIFPSLIKYPGGPENGYFRFVICSEHTKEQVGALLGSIINPPGPRGGTRRKRG